MRGQGGDPAQPRVLPGNGATGGCKPKGVVHKGKEYTGLRPVMSSSIHSTLSH